MTSLVAVASGARTGLMGRRGARGSSFLMSPLVLFAFGVASHYAVLAQIFSWHLDTHLELPAILLPQPPEGWDYKSAPAPSELFVLRQGFIVSLWLSWNMPCRSG